MNSEQSLPTAVSSQRISRLQKQTLAGAVFDAGPRAIVIIAPPGYGKSYLLSELGEAIEGQVWHLTLDAEDADPAYFIKHLHRTTGLSLPAQAEISLSDTVETRRSYLLIDNIELLADSASATLLAELVEHCPAALTLVLAGRKRVFSLTEFLLSGRCRTIELDQLQFSLQETEEWFRQSGGEDLSSLDVQAVQTVTQGWPAGLRFMTLDRQYLQAIAHAEEDVPIAADLSRYFSELLDAQLGSEAQLLLHRTAVLLRFNADLMAAIVGSKGAELFSELCEQNLFVTAQDATQHWFEFHPLLKAYLQRCFSALSEEQRRESYTRAFEWCLVHGLVDDAVEYGLRADNLSQIAALLEQQLATLTADGMFPQVERWLAHVPALMFGAHPQLLVYRCWALTHMGRCFEADRYLDQLARLLAAQSEGSLDQELAVISLVNAVTKDDLAEAQLRLQNIDIEAVENPFSQGACYNAAAIVHWLSGDFTQARQHAELATMAHQQSRSVLGQVYSQCIAAMLSYQQMALYECLELLDGAELLLRKNAINESNTTAALPKVMRAAVLYAWNQTDEAHAILMAILPQLQQCAYLEFRNLGFLTLSRILCRREQFVQALDVLTRSEQANAQCLQQRSQLLLGRQRLRILLRMKDIDAAEQLLRDARIKLQSPPRMPAHWQGISMLQCHMYCLYSFAVEPGEELLLLLRAMHQLAEKASRQQHALDYRLLEIQLLQALRREDEALTLFASVLQALMEEDFIAPLLESDSYRTLCEQLLQTEETGASTRRFLRRLMATGGTVALLPENDVAVESPLSAQEQRILQLIERGLPNKRIASELAVSVNTVRWHISNLLGKLQVANRTEAVAQARRLGFL
jgi:LuxR family maltose regulon positive regulatory protein